MFGFKLYESLFSYFHGLYTSCCFIYELLFSPSYLVQGPRPWNLSVSHLFPANLWHCYLNSPNIHHTIIYTPDPRSTSTGLVCSVVLPIPNWPLKLRPQHLTPPPVMMAHVWAAPMAMEVAEAPVSKGEGGQAIQASMQTSFAEHRPNHR